MTDIDVIKRLALETVSPELYYDLADNIDDMNIIELLEVIACNGDYEQELKIQEKTV